MLGKVQQQKGTLHFPKYLGNLASILALVMQGGSVGHRTPMARFSVAEVKCRVQKGDRQ